MNKLLDRVRRSKTADLTFIAPPVKEVLPNSRTQRLAEKWRVVKAILAAPADYNRAARRAAGVYSRLWRWDMAAMGNQPQAPRYSRRHGQRVLDAAQFNTRPVRRVRKERARIVRQFNVGRPA